MNGPWTAEASGYEDPRGRGRYRMLFITSPLLHRVQLVESPAGRNLHVSVDGVVYVPKDT